MSQIGPICQICQKGLMLQNCKKYHIRWVEKDSLVFLVILVEWFRMVKKGLKGPTIETCQDDSEGSD